MNRTNNRPGGKAISEKTAPLNCPKCGKEFRFLEAWHVYLGHLGLHGLADRYFDGDICQAQKHLRNNGLARQDPAPWNGAFPKYKALPPPKEKGLGDCFTQASTLANHSAPGKTE